MRTTQRLWRALERDVLPSGAALDWKERLGEDLAAIKPYLRTTDEIVRDYPCPWPGHVGCPREVVEHGREDLVAVCRSETMNCPTIALTRERAARRELDVAK